MNNNYDPNKVMIYCLLLLGAFGYLAITMGYRDESEFIEQLNATLIILLLVLNLMKKN